LIYIYPGTKTNIMRKIIVSMHMSLDGYVAGPKGEMNWISFNDELFDYVENLTRTSDTALYGRNTYGMMESYWPTAADKPGASRHDIEHATWYKKANKIVLSKSKGGQQSGQTTFIGENIPAEIEKIKARSGQNIIIFGSPSVVHLLTKHRLIDEYWLFINPVALGRGIPMFADTGEHLQLVQKGIRTFSCGVTCLNYDLKK